jgi:hypothetical protein
MMIDHRRPLVAGTGALLVLCAALCVTPAVPITPSQLPSQLSDRAFWSIVVEFSEENGFFRSDNLVSNETTFQQVIPDLQKRTSPGGVYLGVGPDQNFTYIAATRPRMAFIIDVRRQNMLLHLMYKAIIEQCADRTEFLSFLFSRPKPSGVDHKAGPVALLGAFDEAQPSDELFTKHLRAILNHLVSHHQFQLSADDRRSLEFVYRAFYAGGPTLRYSFPRGGGFRAFPTYAELMSETDSNGGQRSYLASEENFRIVRDLEKRNLLVPIVGDFGGSKAIRSVGQYLRDHGGSVSAFYTSNVEQYLFQGDGWKRFFGNVAALPVDGSGTFIRAFFNMPYQMTAPGIRSVTVLDPIADAVEAFRQGRIQTYYDVFERSRR